MTGYIIREATPDDAAAILVHNEIIANEPDNGITRGPGENMTLEEEQAFLKNSLATDNWIMLVAMTPAGEAIGILGFQGGRRKSNRHEGEFGISVNPEWRDKGVGSALIRHMLEWAKGTGFITRVGLTVMTHNERAFHVYKKMGFELEGCKRAALFKEGRYVDVYMMGLLLMDRT